MSLGESEVRELLLKIEQSEHFGCQDGQVECVAQVFNVTPVLDRGADNIKNALQQQYASGQTGTHRKHQHC